MIMPKCDEIRKRREKLGMSKSGLSKRAGLPANALYRIEKGESETTHPIRAKAIAEALNCELEEVFNVK